MSRFKALCIDSKFTMSQELNICESFLPFSSAPASVGMVTLVSLTESTLTVTWQMPAAPNGLITRYNLSATPTFTIGLDSVLGDVVTTSLDVDVPEQELQAVLVNLVPATVYEVTLTAYTSASGASGPAAEIATNESGKN